MATFSLSGLEELELSMKDLIELPDSVIGEMLNAQGRVVASAQKRKIQELGITDSGQLAASITVNPKVKRTASGASITVSPKGRRKSDSKHKGEKPPSNSEVGFVNEFGAPNKGIPARQWMRTANEGCGDEAVSAAEQVYHRWLSSKGF